MVKKVVICFLLAFLFLRLVSAASISVTSLNSTLIRTTINDASGLYGYEINFSIDSGSVGSVLNPSTHSSFLGTSGTATYGSNQRNSYLYVFGSRLDSSKTGISGSGELFNVSYLGSLTLKGHLLVGTDGTATYTTYNSDGTVTVTTSTVGTSSSGGGGGAVTTFSPGLNARVTPSEISVSVTAGREEERELKIVNTGAEEQIFSISALNLGGIMTLEKISLKLSPGQEGTIKLKFNAREGRLITGKIIITSKGLGIEVPVIVNVKSENFLFDTSITLLSRVIDVGGTLVSQINLKQVGLPEKIDIVANYIIKDFEGNVYLEDSETFFVLDQKDFVKEFYTSELYQGKSLPPGKYVLGLEIVYPGAFAVSSVQFEVIGEELLLSPKRFDQINYLIIAGVIVLIVFAGLIFWASIRKKASFIHKRKNLRKK